MNIHFLIAGIFLILFSAVHIIFGELTVFQPLFKNSIDPILKISVYIPWYQLALVLLLSGVTQILAAFRKTARALSPFVLAIILGNLVVFLTIAVLQGNWYVLQSSIPQYILFGIVLVFMLLGIRKHRLEEKVESK